jgi:hypothetical protein
MQGCNYNALQSEKQSPENGAFFMLFSQFLAVFRRF